MRPLFADPKLDFVFKKIFGSDEHNRCSSCCSTTCSSSTRRTGSLERWLEQALTATTAGEALR